MDEFLHQVGIARHDDNEILAVVLHAFQQDFDGLAAKIVAVLLVDQGVGLVDEQHAAQSFLDDLLGFQGGLSHISGHQAGAVHLDELSLGQNADGVVNFGQQTGHRGLAGAGVAHKHQMEGHGGNGQTGFLPELSHLHQVDEAFHILLHPFQTTQSVQLGQNGVQVGLFHRFRGRFRFGLLLNWGGGVVGDELLGAHGGGGIRVLGTQGQQVIGTAVDKSRLRLADHIVHCRKGQQQKGELIHKTAGQISTHQPVVFQHGQEKIRGCEAGGIGHAAGDLPI